MTRLHRVLGTVVVLVSLVAVLTMSLSAKTVTGGKSSTTQAAKPSHVAHGRHGQAVRSSHSKSSKSAKGRKTNSTSDASGVHPCKKRSKCRARAVRRADSSPRMTVAPDEPLKTPTGEESSSVTEASIINPSALAPFFERLSALEANSSSGSVHILHYGDSHTAADMFTGEMRARLQARFGDGGTGFSAGGYPFAGYRVHGTKRSQTAGWTTEGTHLRDIGDGLLGIGGISISTDQPGESVTLDAEAQTAELFYLQQPGGGRIEIYESDASLVDGTSAPVATISTDGELSAGIFTIPTAGESAVMRHFEVRTLDAAPVRIFGFTAQKNAGLTYEVMGINGAEASLILKWNEKLQSAYIAQRKPALVVLDYGTNEAANHTWEYENYKSMFRELIARVRRAAPGVPILVLGPTDRDLRATRRRWANFQGTERITKAQRDLCMEEGCAFWSQQGAMGGWGSMGNWVRSGLAQGDHTHLTAAGYIKLADSLTVELMHQYEDYLKTAARN